MWTAEKKRQYAKEYYQKNKDRILENNRVYYQRTRQHHLSKMAEYRNRPEQKEKMKKYLHRYYAKNQGRVNRVKSAAGCCLCGYNVHPDALDLHHRLPEDKSKRQNLFGTRNWESIREEVENCIVLCSNCHRLIHVNLSGE
jgi:hypothetical protein